MIEFVIIFFVLFFIVAIIFIQALAKPQQQQQQQLQEQIQKLLQQTRLQPQQPQQPQFQTQQQIDCVGVWEDVGECTINRCDPIRNTIGLGKQKRKFVASTQSQNQGKPCPGTIEEVDCSLNNYIGCTQCGGSDGERVTGASCDNIKRCDGLIGIGERIDKWSVSSYNTLPYCVMPKDSKVTCMKPWPYCDCTYNISDKSNCNETNTVCEGSTSTCAVNFTKIK
jgi:hypothetical protein